MKIISSIFLSLLLTMFAAENLNAQDKTIILLRHAEKDVSANANKADPELTAQGRERAQRLLEVLKKYQPQQIYSTIFKRARDTAAPLAENLHPDYRMQIQFYDYNEIEELAAKLLKLKAKSVIVVGHNSTTTELANFLIKQNKYRDLADDEYNKIFIIKIHGGKIEDRVVEY